MRNKCLSFQEVLHLQVIVPLVLGWNSIMKTTLLQILVQLEVILVSLTVSFRIKNPKLIILFIFFYVYFHSDLQDSADIAEFLANFLRRIVKKRDQKLILENNFINKNSDDFYVLQLCFFDIFGLVIQK